MSVLKIVIVSLFFIRLFAINLYVPKKFRNINIKNITIKTYKSKKEINFSNSLVMLSYNDLPYIFDKNLEIITPIGEVKDYILTHQNPLCKIRKIIDIDFTSKILLDKCDGHYKVVKGTFKEFLNNKTDAIVYYKKLNEDNIFDFPLKLYGLDFNKYFIVAKKKFVKKNYKKIEILNKIFENSFDFRKDLIYKTLLVSGLYLHKVVKFNKILFENYKLKKEKQEGYLKVILTGEWAPFQIVKNNHIYGIGVDFWRLIAKKANLKYKFIINSSWVQNLNAIKTRKADLIISTSSTPDRRKYAIFSKPYASFPLGIICKRGEHFNYINDIKTIAAGKNFTAEKLMKKYYPNIHYIETKDILEALKLVKNKKAQCAVDILPVILWTISKNHLMNLQLAFKTPFEFNVQMMVRNDYPKLLERINKAINEITPQEKERIINSYLKGIVIQQNNDIDKYLLWTIIIVVFITLILFYINRQKFKKIKKEAMYDELTGLLNRRGIDYKIKDMDNGSILFFDIDHFKKINDTYGHEFGDFVLKELGKILREYFRRSDIVARWGGEEFIVILPGTNYKDVLKVAEKLREIVENYNFNNVRVTISIGVSEYYGNLEVSLMKADEALYEAKNNGRNQIKGKR